jgi:hypothetical protein
MKTTSSFQTIRIDSGSQSGPEEEEQRPCKPKVLAAHKLNPHKFGEYDFADTVCE